jgi:hypothetical protein
MKMSNIEIQVELYNQKVRELDKFKNEIENNSKKEGYSFNPKTGKLTKLSEDIIVVDMYIDTRTIDESSGWYYTYAKLSEVPEKVFNDIKQYMTNNEKDWLNLFDDEKSLRKIDGMKDFLELFEFFSNGYIDEDNIKYCQSGEEMNDYNRAEARKGCVECYGECNFDEYMDSQESVDGYITFFKMKRDIFEQTKYERKFQHERYISDNMSYEYKTK